MNTTAIPLTAAVAARWQALRLRLAEIARQHPDAALASSLAAEDMLLTHAIYDGGIPLEVFTLDTGRLFPEVYELWAQTEERYGIVIRGYAPKAGDVEQLVLDQGINGFRASPEARKRCCSVRN